MLFRSSGGDRVPDPRLFARIVAPFCCFLAARSVGEIKRENEVDKNSNAARNSNTIFMHSGK